MPCTVTPPTLEHIGIAVRDAEAVAALYRRLLGAARYKTEDVESQHVRTHFLPAGAAKLELVEALSEEAPIRGFLEKRGEGVHHLAFEVADVEAALARVRQQGFTPLSDASTPGADGKRVFFLHPKETHGVLVEFCQQMPVPLPAEHVPFRGGHVAAYVQGAAEAPPLVVLHGAAGATQSETAPLVRRLAPRFRVVALDFTRHGASPDLGIEFSGDLFAANVRAVLDHVGIGRAHVFGFSMGGYAALHLARHSPGHVRRLAVHATCTAWTDALARAMTARLDADALAERNPAAAGAMAHVHGDWRRLFRRTAAFGRTLPTASARARTALSRVEAPTLVSAVDRDDLFPLDAALDAHRHLPDARRAVLPGTRHALPAADLDLLAALLRKHFDEEAA